MGFRAINARGCATPVGGPCATRERSPGGALEADPEFQGAASAAEKGGRQSRSGVGLGRQPVKCDLLTGDYEVTSGGPQVSTTTLTSVLRVLPNQLPNKSA